MTDIGEPKFLKGIDLRKIMPKRFSTRTIYLPAASDFGQYTKDLSLTHAQVLDIYGADANAPPSLMGKTFDVERTSRPKITTRDFDFERNTNIAVDSMGGVKARYFIADCGKAHLFGIAYSLRKRGVNVAFYLSDSPQRIEVDVSHLVGDLRTDTDAMLYYAKQYRQAKSEIPSEESTMATMIDYHRIGLLNGSDLLPKEAFAGTELLKRAGINEIVIFGEDYATQNGEIPEEETDLLQVLNQYQKEGMKVTVIRIDSKQKG